ncbi:MAG TPA: hypothetical protein VMN03_05550 [Burkholderiales bacterium]|nr:hypothetical protein [Burkholderiales bacterium]
MRRLVILGSGVTALAVVRSAHRMGVIPVLVDGKRGIATASRLARVAVLPGRRQGDVMELLASIGRIEPAALIATSDAWVRFVAACRPQLDLAYRRVLHPPNRALDVCLSKEKFGAWCAAHALPAPARYPVGAGFRPDDPALRFPLLLRPDETLHSNPESGLPKAAEAASPAELARLLEEYRREGAEPVLSQSLLGRKLRQYSVGLARTRGRMMTFVTRKLRPLPQACSTGTLVETVEQPEVEALARRAAELLDYEGIAEIEVLHDETSGENFLIEINARPWQQFALAAATGHDLLRFVLSEGPAAPGPASPGRAGLWLDFKADLYACFGREGGLVRAGQLAFADYLRTLFRANVFARWSTADPGPFCRDALAFVAARWRRLRSRPGVPAGLALSPRRPVERRLQTSLVRGSPEALRP